MMQIDVGDGSAAAPDMVALGGSGTITVSNLAGGSTLNLFTAGIDQAPTTLNAGSQTTVSPPTWLQSTTGKTSVQLFGGMYG